MDVWRATCLCLFGFCLQASSRAGSEGDPCTPGFGSDTYVFRVERLVLQPGRRLGTVVFNDCTSRTRTLYDSVDKRFRVDTDGTVKIKRQVTLHNGHTKFSIHAWDSQGRKYSVAVRVEHNPQQDETQVDYIQNVEVISSFQVLNRVKRAWVIPPAYISENLRGPFPYHVVQIKSDNDEETQIYYKISGEGANQPPVGLFIIDKFTGEIRVTQPLDRESKSQYKLKCHAMTGTGVEAEKPMDVIVYVMDQNDNRPVFTQNPYTGSVAEASKKGTEILKVNATDADDPSLDNGVVRYRILSQSPPQPNEAMFSINSVTGGILVNSESLDREKYPTYTLEIEAADMDGKGMTTISTAIITVTDSNDNPPRFQQNEVSYKILVGAEVVKMSVTDDDEANSPAWKAKFRIVDGDPGGSFSVATGPSGQDGIISTVKPLDFEMNKLYVLRVAVENEIPFAVSLPTATATVTVNVEDVNEAPIFKPTEKTITVPEDVALDSDLVSFKATDPDTARNQKVTYKIGSDPAGWLDVVKDSGLIKVKKELDRESPYVKNARYKALILAIDNGGYPLGTGTLMIELQDINDNAPTIEEYDIKVCNKESSPVLLTVKDKDGEGNTFPFRVQLRGEGPKNWSAEMNTNQTSIILTLKSKLEEGVYNVVLRVFDSQNLFQDNTLHATVCDCTGSDVQCQGRISEAGFGLPVILGILGALLALLLLVLLLLMFMRKNKVKKEPLLPPEDDLRDNVYYYDEEGGGEDDQDYDLSVLHRGLDNRPEVFRNDVEPTFMPAPQYRPRPANPDEIGNFIDDNLKAADNDPTAPPYDSLLVFDYEGGGSDAGSLSSLNSSSSGEDQDYDCLNEWGPRFKKLADMYGGGED
uniref:Cadherin-1 n=1 Tax=Denticeps clupeoides TaxID=299321 RepID=A0AAY4DKE2_9TELE